MLTTIDGGRIISRVETSGGDRPYCETWADHDFSAMRLVDGGRDRRRGAYLRFEASCSKCPKKVRETRWTDIVGVDVAQP